MANVRIIVTMINLTIKTALRENQPLRSLQPDLDFDDFLENISAKKQYGRTQVLLQNAFAAIFSLSTHGSVE
jgi:hypothetical protein